MTPIIVDDHSTYPPLLEWYKQSPCEIYHVLSANGQWSLWDGMNNILPNGYFYVTDNDLNYTGIPDDFQDRLMAAMVDSCSYLEMKVGFSLEINDIPEPNASRIWCFGQTIAKWEQQWWDITFPQGYYDAHIDTTFALYKNRTWVTSAIRLRRPYTCRHLPWYLDYAHLDDEYSYYVDHAGPGSTVVKRIKEFRENSLTNQVPCGRI
jgi:hypothetical protein